MNILTDILSLIRRKQFVKAAKLDDVIVLGINEEPDMTGVASPIPYKSVRLIKVKDFKVAAEHCDHSNSPEAPSAGTAQVYQKTEIDPITEKCTVFFRSLKSMSTNLTLATSADDNYIEITTTGEPNTGANVGTGAEVFKDKVGETLNFRTLTSNDNSVTITQGTDEIDLSVGASTIVVDTIGSGSGYMSYIEVENVPTAGSSALVYPKFKLAGSKMISGNLQYSFNEMDWTDSDHPIDVLDPAENKIWAKPGYASIPIGKILSSDDRLTLNTLISIRRIGGFTPGSPSLPGIFTLVGWYKCSDIANNKWPLRDQTIHTDTTPSVNDGIAYSCSQNSILISGSTTIDSYAALGVSFDGLTDGDIISLSWSITTTKN